MRYLLFILLLASPILAAPAPSPNDWPSFRRNLALTGDAPPATTLPEIPAQLWKIDLNEAIESTAAIVGDRVYIATQKGRILALNLSDGSQIWQYKAKSAISASPCIADGRLFVGDEIRTFYALDANTGHEIWTYRSFEKFMSSPIVLGDCLLVGCYDKNLYCFDPANGDIRWTFKITDPVHASPAILDDPVSPAVVIAGCDKFIRLIDLQSGEQCFEYPAENVCAASPALAGGHAYVGDLSGNFFSFNLDTGKLQWKILNDNPEHPLGFISSSAAVAPDAVYFATEGNQVVRADRATGHIDWAFATRDQFTASPVLVGDRLFIGDTHGDLYALNTADGAVRWKFPMGGHITASAAIAQNRLIIGNSAGALYCFGNAPLHPNTPTSTPPTPPQSTFFLLYPTLATIFAILIATALYLRHASRRRP